MKVQIEFDPAWLALHADRPPHNPQRWREITLPIEKLSADELESITKCFNVSTRRFDLHAVDPYKAGFPTLTTESTPEEVLDSVVTIIQEEERRQEQTYSTLQFVFVATVFVLAALLLFSCEGFRI